MCFPHSFVNVYTLKYYLYLKNKIDKLIKIQINKNLQIKIKSTPLEMIGIQEVLSGN